MQEKLDPLGSFLMKYKLVTVRSFEKSFKKFPPNVRTHIKEKVFDLENDPNSGSRLTGAYRDLWSLHTKFKGTEYRVLYTITDTRKEVTLIYTSSRENFYREISRLNLKF